MSNTSTGGPAFPLTVNDGKTVNWNVGMTLRDYFAAKAMQGFVANLGIIGGNAPSDADIARYSYDIADAMLKAREE